MASEVVVLTGAAGCLGFHVLRLLIRSDEAVKEVRCLDVAEPEALMSSHIAAELETFRTNHEGKTKLIKWIKGDVRDINVVERTLAGSDCIIHCAAKIDLWTEEASRDKLELETINVGGTETLLRAAVRLGVGKFIHVSSFESYASYDTIYYATEQTLPQVNWFTFGSSGRTKKQAEEVVKRYSNSKLQLVANNGESSLGALIIRFPPFYGQFEKFFVSHLMKVARFFNGRLQRYSNIWIRQQPIYVENAAWSILKAKHCLATDSSIHGEEFHVTDDTAIVDPFDFAEPFLETKGLSVTKDAHFFLPTLLLVCIFSALRRLFGQLSVISLPFGWRRRHGHNSSGREPESFKVSGPQKRWYDYLTAGYLGFMCNSHFLNRTKASLRLKYEPIVEPEEAKRRATDWYREHVKV